MIYNSLSIEDLEYNVQYFVNNSKYEYFDLEKGSLKQVYLKELKWKHKKFSRKNLRLQESSSA